MGFSRFALLLLPFAATAHAQAIKNDPPVRAFSVEEVGAIPMPEIAFDAETVKEEDFEKYFFFHRPDTSFDVAYADITECDYLGSGINFYEGVDDWAVQNAMMQNGLLAGAIGGAIASVMVDAIFGSAERRKIKRVNVRNCMFYKGYDRYGLEKGLWQEFNFEEGFSKENAEDRAAKLLMQAKVASGPKPALEVLEP